MDAYGFLRPQNAVTGRANYYCDCGICSTLIILSSFQIRFPALPQNFERVTEKWIFSLKNNNNCSVFLTAESVQLTLRKVTANQKFSRYVSLPFR